MRVNRREFLQHLAALAGAGALSGLAGCAPAPTPTPSPQPTTPPKPAAATATAAPVPTATPKPLTKATFRLNWKITGPHVPYFLAVDRGFYKAQGIDLELKEGSGSGPAAQLVGNKSDTFGLIDAAAAIPLIVQGLPIKCVGMVAPRTSLGVIARKDSGIKTLKDLEGKTLAVTPGDSLTQIWPAVVAANKLDASKIRLVNVDAAAKIPAVLEKKADALLGSVADQNFTLQAQGVETVDLAFPDFGVNVLNLGIFVHVDTLKQGELITAFLKATKQGLLASEKDAGAAIALMKKSSPELDEKVVTQQYKAHASQWKSPNCPDKGYIFNCPEDWKQTLEIMVQYRDLKTTMKPEDFYTNDFIPKD